MRLNLINLSQQSMRKVYMLLLHHYLWLNWWRNLIYSHERKHNTSEGIVLLSMKNRVVWLQISAINVNCKYIYLTLTKVASMSELLSTATLKHTKSKRKTVNKHKHYSGIIKWTNKAGCHWECYIWLLHLLLSIPMYKV